jgi:hypothetical protein
VIFSAFSNSTNSHINRWPWTRFPLHALFSMHQSLFLLFQLNLTSSRLILQRNQALIHFLILFNFNSVPIPKKSIDSAIATGNHCPFFNYICFRLAKSFKIPTSCFSIDCSILIPTCIFDPPLILPVALPICIFN